MSHTCLGLRTFAELVVLLENEVSLPFFIIGRHYHYDHDHSRLIPDVEREATSLKIVTQSETMNRDEVSC